MIAKRSTERMSSSWAPPTAQAHMEAGSSISAITKTSRGWNRLVDEVTCRFVALSQSPPVVSPYLPKRRILVLVAVTAAVLTTGYGFYCSLYHYNSFFGFSKRHSGMSASVSGDVEEDDIVFTDSVESRFEGTLRLSVQPCAEQLQLALDDLAYKVEERDLLRKLLSTHQEHLSPTTEGEFAEEASGTPKIKELEFKIAELTHAIEFRALQSNEFLTQYIIALDGLPVCGRRNLKKRRRELIGSAMTLTDRIMLHLETFHPKSSTGAVQVDGQPFGFESILSEDSDTTEKR